MHHTQIHARARARTHTHTHRGDVGGDEGEAREVPEGEAAEETRGRGRREVRGRDRRGRDTMAVTGGDVTGGGGDLKGGVRRRAGCRGDAMDGGRGGRGRAGMHGGGCVAPRPGRPSHPTSPASPASPTHAPASPLPAGPSRPITSPGPRIPALHHVPGVPHAGPPPGSVSAARRQLRRARPGCARCTQGHSLSLGLSPYIRGDGDCVAHGHERAARSCSSASRGRAEDSSQQRARQGCDGGGRDGT